MIKKNNTSSYQIDMTSGPVFSKLLLFSIPLVLSSLLQLLFNAADIIVVGRFAGDNSLAAVGSTSALINLLVNLFVGLSVGTNVVAAHFFGAGKKRELEQTVHTAMLLSIYSGIIITIAGVIGAWYILTLMQAPEEVLQLASLYLKIYFCGMPATMAYNFGSALLRAKGDTKRPLYYLLTAGIINVLLNLLFVIVFRMDVAGVAFATIISQYISAALIIQCLRHETGDFKLILRNLTLNRNIFIKILKIGLPAGFQGIVFSLSNVIIQSAVNTFGATVIAGNSAASNIEGFVYTSMNGFAQGTLTFVSQNTGARQFKRIRRLVLISEASVFVIGLVLGSSIVLFGPILLGIYSSNQDVITAGMFRLSIIGISYALCGMMDVMANAIRGLGQSLLPMLVTLIGACGIRLLWLATIFMYDSFHTTRTIYFSYPVSWGITFLALLLCFVKIISSKMKQTTGS